MKIKDWIIGSGSSVMEDGFLYPFQLKLGGKWHRSKDKKGDISSFGSYMLNKKWTLEEEFNNHMLRFQQVTGWQLFIPVNSIVTFPGWIVGQ